MKCSHYDDSDIEISLGVYRISWYPILNGGDLFISNWSRAIILKLGITRNQNITNYHNEDSPNETFSFQ